MTDLYKSTMDSQIYDLDDLSIYEDEWKTMGIWDLYQKCLEQAAYAMFYMDFHNAHKKWGKQRTRVVKMCREIVQMRDIQVKQNDRLSLLKWLFKFKDEIENMC